MTREQLIELYEADPVIAAQLQADGETIARLAAALHNSEAQRTKMADAEAVRQSAPVAHMHIGGGMVSGSPVDIDAASARIAELEAALRPFAWLAERHDDRGYKDTDGIIFPGSKACVVMGDLRRARAALRPADKGDAT